MTRGCFWQSSKQNKQSSHYTLHLHLHFGSSQEARTARFIFLGAGAMDWPTFVSQVENPSPGPTMVDTAMKWFQDKLGARHLRLPEGFTEAMVESSLPSDIVVQACCKRLLRAVQAVAAARLAQTTGPSPASSQQSTSAQQLASILGPVGQGLI